MKDMRDVKKDYGYILRWTIPFVDGAGDIVPARYFLEDCVSKERQEITDRVAIQYIKKKTVKAFRGCVDVYENYEGLFEILKIKPTELVHVGPVIKNVWK